MKDLGKKIKQYRTSINMTQADFAYRLGVTGASVSAYENGTRAPSFDVLVRIANILGVSTDDLLGRKRDGLVTIDVTNLSTEQRRVIHDLVRIFSQENRFRLTMLDEGGVGDRLESLGYLNSGKDE